MPSRRRRIDNSSLRKLQLKWDEILEESDFVDIELRLPDGERVLKNYTANTFFGLDALEMSTRLEFFLECSSMVTKTKFKNKTDRIIMEKFCEGISRQQIKVELAKIRIYRHRTTIEKVIKKYLILYGLRNGK